MKYNPDKIQNILKSFEPGAIISTDTMEKNTTYLVEVINELLMAQQLSWLDDAAKRAMQGLLASPQTFGGNLDESVEKVAEYSVKSALALRKALNQG